MKQLHEQSGFGWDNGHQLVTAPSDMWDRYLIVSSCSYHVSHTNYWQAHPNAKLFKKKPFILYDELATLCDHVLATSNDAFRGGMDQDSRHDGEGVDMDDVDGDVSCEVDSDGGKVSEQLVRNVAKKV